VQSSLGLFAVVLFGFLLNLTVLSQLQHVIAQQQARATLADELAAGSAPVSEGTVDNVLLSNGAPLARIEIPAIGVDEIIVEGTSAATLTAGPGHRRDTVLPGQVGVSILMGRATAYGGPFRRIQELPPGETLSVITGQGEQIYRVLGVRYAGDPSIAYTAGTSRLVMETARGAPFMPSGVVRVDAELVSAVKPFGTRQTTSATLPPQDLEMASDFSTVWAAVFARPLRGRAAVAAGYCLRRFGGAKTWVVFVPVLLLSGLLVADQLTRLLPNLL
jgi:sortase (surface protein transpeptidase)